VSADISKAQQREGVAREGGLHTKMPRLQTGLARTSVLDCGVLYEAVTRAFNTQWWGRVGRGGVGCVVVFTGLTSAATPHQADWLPVLLLCAAARR